MTTNDYCNKCGDGSKFHNCPVDMAKLLSEKLTKEQFRILADMIDSDPPAGPFWEAIQDKNTELHPELYVDTDELIKREV